MRLILFTFCAFSVSLLSACSTGSPEIMPEAVQNTPSASSASEPKQPVLVELFTSEGCSSCPPADKALAFLKSQQPVSGVDIVALAYHVDYWNHIGWMDRFSSPQFSKRQESYTGKFALDSIYTPQMVVDGNAQFTGSDTGRATKEIAKAVQDQKGKASLSFANKELKVAFGELPPTGGATVYLAVAEDNLSSDVLAGENRGSKLQHVAVVRELREIGKIGTGEVSTETTAKFEIKPEWKQKDLLLIVFAQDDRTKNVLAIGTIKP